jgi:hypothetical protein
MKEKNATQHPKFVSRILSSKPQMKPTDNKKSKNHSTNALDPVMLSEIPKGVPKFIFTRPNGTKVEFIATSLVDYILSSGDFCDPESRLPFSDVDLATLDSIMTKNKLKKESVLKAKLNPDRFTDIKFKRDALCGKQKSKEKHITV